MSHTIYSQLFFNDMKNLCVSVRPRYVANSKIFYVYKKVMLQTSKLHHIPNNSSPFLNSLVIELLLIIISNENPSSLIVFLHNTLLHDKLEYQYQCSKSNNNPLS